MIAIGNNFGGPEQKCSVAYNVLNRAMNVAADKRPPIYDDGSESWINPIFLVPDSVFKPDFVGIKRGHFSRAKKGLVLMIAVPEELVSGHGLGNFVVASLRECVRIAASHFKSKGISFSALGAEKIILEMEREIASG